LFTAIESLAYYAPYSGILILDAISHPIQDFFGIRLGKKV